MRLDLGCCFRPRRCLVASVDGFNSGCRGTPVGDRRSQARTEHGGTGGNHQRHAADYDTADQPGRAAHHLSFLLRASDPTCLGRSDRSALRHIEGGHQFGHPPVERGQMPHRQARPEPGRSERRELHLYINSLYDIPHLHLIHPTVFVYAFVECEGMGLAIPGIDSIWLLYALKRPLFGGLAPPRRTETRTRRGTELPCSPASRFGTLR